MEEKLKKVKEILQKFNQEHLLQKYEDLNEEYKQKLLDQILSINFEEVQNLYKQTKIKPQINDVKIEPINFIEKAKLTNEEKNKYEETGKKVMAKGKYAVVTMAGGQGTRLRT